VIVVDFAKVLCEWCGLLSTLALTKRKHRGIFLTQRFQSMLQ
jgi:hypothetical protein